MTTKETKTKKPFKISKETIIIIIIILVVFAGWNLLLPRLFKVSEVKNIALPQVKRGNIEFIDKQIENRTLQVPSLVPSNTQLGKQNPFE
ncbi:hypothetical protein [Caldisericum exile]|uniref:Uncharacterized protein n=1 Tax=Caldisericum exile (strain DSM 21853 / NBRC 104410 / AZM16c01) TaxID=511051 RepID=A0A7U6JH12_CALEA|nr:hypothetical protein [Caldisericum exile]BAL81187.1 hypothetical protein CSE_10610 [Caldisericum exile AZM16c01]